LTDERLALIVRSAFRGMMEAVLEVDSPAENLEAPASPEQEPPRLREAPPEELAFPSVTAAEEEIFGETPPPLVGIDRAVSDYSTMRQRQAQDAAPDVQGGPGEKEVAEWLRIPQA
jgi:hypothetical protein